MLFLWVISSRCLCQNAEILELAWDCLAAGVSRRASWLQPQSHRLALHKYPRSLEGLGLPPSGRDTGGVHPGCVSAGQSGSVLEASLGVSHSGGAPPLCNPRLPPARTLDASSNPGFSSACDTCVAFCGRRPGPCSSFSPHGFWLPAHLRTGWVGSASLVAVWGGVACTMQEAMQVDGISMLRSGQATGRRVSVDSPKRLGRAGRAEGTR